MSFSDLGLSPETLKAVAEAGYETPTPIQEQAIPYVLMGRDVLGIAQTGTGKTAGFTLPMIDILAHGRAKARMPRSLIIAPTRELANQVADNFTKYGRYHKLSMALLIGGESFVEQEKLLSRGVDVLIATPGRLLDLFDRGRILLQDVKVLVIDEADRMLDMGFIPDVERIVSLLPPLRQTLFFSATMDKQIAKLADAFLHNPKEVRVALPSSTAETVEQHLVITSSRDKRRALRHILEMEDVKNAFIFCNRKRDVGVLHRSLTRHGYDAAQLHGDMPQNERTAALAAFKEGRTRLMVCSDVAARGIDVAAVSHVFNFDVPSHSEDYVHRIGRTGRAGQQGRAYTIATPEDAKYVAAIEKLIGKAIPRIDIEALDTPSLDEGESKGRGRRDSRRKDSADTKAEAQTPPKGDSRRSDKPGRGRKRRGHPTDEVQEMAHGNDVLAFGDHTPAFILAPQSGAEARALKAAKTKAASAEEKPAKRRRPSKKAAEAAPEAALEPAPETATPDTEQAVTAEAPAREETPKRRRTTRRTAADAAAEAQGPVEAAATPTTSEDSAPAEATAAAPDTAITDTIEEKPKRKRAPRKQTTATATPDTPDAGNAEEAAAASAAAPEAAGDQTTADQTATEQAEDAEGADKPAAKKPARRRTTRSKAAAQTADAATGEADAAPADSASADAEAAPAEEEAVKKPATRRRAATKKATTSRKTTVKKAAKAESVTESTPGEDSAAAEKPKRKRTTRSRKAEAASSADAPATDTAPQDTAPPADSASEPVAAAPAKEAVGD